MNLYKRLYVITRCVGLILLFLAGYGNLFAQEKEKSKVLELTIRVVDEADVAVSDAEIVVGEGFAHGVTDQSGEYKLKAKPTDFISVSKPGFEKTFTSMTQLNNDPSVVLKRSIFYRSEDDRIQLPYAYNFKRNTTGDYIVITGEELEKYPSNDLRNALVGLIPGLTISEKEGSTGTSAEETRGQFGVKTKVAATMRGFSPIYIIDDIQIDITEMQLDPSEVETVTFIKDVVGKAMYGPQAANGVIFIKTKKGKANERILNVNVEAGISAVDRFPQWATAGEYARLNNQARINDGLSPLYDEAAIAGYDRNDPYDKIYPAVNFQEMMFKDLKPYQRVNVSSTGGNNFIKYFAYLGYSGEGDNFKIGSKADYNRLNARANLDMNVNEFINVEFGFFGGLTIRRSPNYGYDKDYGKDNNDDAELDIFEYNSAIADATSIAPNAFPVYAAFDEETGLPWYGLSSTFKRNPIGNLVDNGYYNETGRLGAANVALNYNMNHLVKGLKSRTYVGFNAFNLTRIGKAEQYAAYIATPNADKTDVTLEKVWDLTEMSGQAKLHDYYFQRFSGYQTFSYDRVFNDVHGINTALTYHLSKYTRNQVENPFCQQNVNWMGNYTFDNKYTLQAAVTFAGTQSLIGSRQYQFYPSFGASWVISDEKFMSGLKFIDFLKLRAEYGELGYQSLNPTLFMYEDKWSVNSSGSAFGPHTNNQWFGNNTDNDVYRSTYNKLGNPNLNWETRKEFSAGIDASLFHHKLAVNISYYNTIRGNEWVRPSNQYPLVVGLLATPYVNYNKTRYYGAELSARYTDKIGDFRYSIGAMATLPRTNRIKYDQPNYRSDYQSRIDKPTDAYFGLVYQGRFNSDEEANKIPQLFDESLKAGDFKYADLNNDGVVDDNDMEQIGNTSPRLIYALNINLAYKNFELTIVGDGRSGFDIPMTNKYFHNGWGDNNYSKYLVDNVGTENLPRLTYYKIENNYKASTFWLKKGDYFKLQNIEIAYNLPLATASFMGIRKARFFVRGANVATISGIKDIDPESTTSGIDSYPLNRTFTGGIKLTF